jgi:hypothetical protein
LLLTENGNLSAGLNAEYAPDFDESGGAMRIFPRIVAFSPRWGIRATGLINQACLLP